MVIQTQIDTRPAEAFVAAIAALDFEDLAWCLDPDVRFRALTPNHTFGHFGSDSAVTTIRGWFEDSSLIELIDSKIESIGDRVRVGYRVRALKDGVWRVVEQQAYCTLDEGVITDVSLICSGFRPEF